MMKRKQTVLTMAVMAALLTPIFGGVSAAQLSELQTKYSNNFEVNGERSTYNGTATYDNNGTFTLTKGTGTDDIIKVQNTEDLQNPGTLKIHGFTNLYFQNGSNSNDTANTTLWAAENTQVLISNIGTIQFGTKDQALNSAQGVMAAGGNLTINADTITGNVTGNGFVSQNWGSTAGSLTVNTTKDIHLINTTTHEDGQKILSNGLVVAMISHNDDTSDTMAEDSENSNTISAKGNVSLYTKESASGVVYLFDASNQKGKAKIDISGDNGVNIANDYGRGIYSGLNGAGNESTINIASTQGETSITSTNNAVQLDSRQAKDDSKGNKTTVTISGEKGVKIVSSAGHGLYTNLSGKNNQGSVDVTSKGGDVSIQASTEAILSSYFNTASTTMNVSGNNVNVESTEDNRAIFLNGNTKLSLVANKDQGVIRIHSGSQANEGIYVGDSSSLSIGEGNKTNQVELNGYITVSGSDASVTVKDNTTTVVDASSFGDKGLVYASNGGNFIAEGNAQLIVKGAVTGSNLYTNEKSDANTKDGNQQTFKFWDVKNTRFDNPFQYLSKDGKVEADITNANKESIAGYAASGVALAATKANDAKLKPLLTDVESYNGAVGIGQAGGIQHSTYAVTGLFTDALADHDNIPAKDLWAKGFHSKENIDGLGFDGGALSLDTQYNGTVVGMDVYQNEHTNAGVAITYADGNISSSNGGVYTKNDATYVGASLYGLKDLGSYRLAADLSYVGGSHDITQRNAGQVITAKPDTEAWTLGVKAMKDYDLTRGTLTPYVGLRYLRLTTDGYTSSVGLSYDKENQNLFLLPVGVDYSLSVKRGSWEIKPYAGLSYIWTMGDRNADQTVSYGSASDVFSYDITDAGSFLGKVGVSASKGDYSFGVGYTYQTGSSVDSHTWSVKASYAF